MGYINKGSLIYRSGRIQPLKNWAIVDLDGTLCDHSHRLKYAKLENGPDWTSYNELAIHDPIRTNIMLLVLALHHSGVGICIMTARSNAYSRVTMDWIEKFGVPHDLVLMREQSDLRSSEEVKLELYNNYFMGLGRRVRLVLEDRDKIVEMWRSIGLTCLQVVKGEY